MMLIVHETRRADPAGECDETMTLGELEARFPSEWVLVVDPEVDEHLELVRGRVVYHSKLRDELDDAALRLRPESSAVLYTGRIPEGSAVVL